MFSVQTNCRCLFFVCMKSPICRRVCSTSLTWICFFLLRFNESIHVCTIVFGGDKKKQQIKNAVQFSIWGMYIVHRLQFSRTHRQCCAHSISEFGLFDSFLSYKFNAFCLHDSNKNKNTIKQHKINEKQQKKINNIFEKNVDSQKVALPKISTTLVWCLYVLHK